MAVLWRLCLPPLGDVAISRCAAKRRRRSASRSSLASTRRPSGPRAGERHLVPAVAQIPGLGLSAPRVGRSRVLAASITSDRRRSGSTTSRNVAANGISILSGPWSHGLTRRQASGPPPSERIDGGVAEPTRTARARSALTPARRQRRRPGRSRSGPVAAARPPLGAAGQSSSCSFLRLGLLAQVIVEPVEAALEELPVVAPASRRRPRADSGAKPAGRHWAGGPRVMKPACSTPSGASSRPAGSSGTARRAR